MSLERRRLLCIAAGAVLTVLLAAAPAACADDAPEPAQPGVLAGGAALRPFFAALSDLARHRRRQPLRIMQLGDSHTANDALSGRLRELFQGRFGAAGRGWLPAGIPFKYYRPALVSVSETGWRHINRGEAAAGTPLGLDGVAAEAEAPGARMTLTSIDPDGFDRVGIEFVARPHGARLALRIDNGPAERIATAARRAAVRRIERSLSHPARQIELTAAGGSGQQVLGWSVERGGPGVIYENHGTIGATIALLRSLSPAAVSFELAARRPALLVVAFGTNEAFKDALDLAAYAALFRGAVADLRRHAPGAAVLVLGPPDGNRRPPDCAAAAPPQPCGGHAACSWAEPRDLAAVRDIQRRVARQQGWAFWDWAAAMGGHCSIDRWLARDPALAMPDHVHLNEAGYAAIADVLFGDLMREYARWKMQHRVRH